MPPARMPLVRAGRQRKRWRWVGLFASDVMACAAVARVGVAWQAWWAVWDREGQRLEERTRRSPRGIDVAPGRARVKGVMDLEVDEAAVTPVEVMLPAGRAYTWTRKRAGVPARGRVRLGGELREVEGLAVVDESAGYHPRHTAWRWSAGVGHGEGGEQVAWNLVTGINDPATGSERAIWVDGRPEEVGPVSFAADLSALRFDGGEGLDFTAEAVRARRESLVVFRSDYEQPFGTFTGVLPGGLRLVEGLGVMERHEVVW